MFYRCIHIFMIATVLVCPALGGWCCGAAEGSDAVGNVGNDETCGHDCCHEETKSDQPHPLSCPGPCPEACHDCFCAGALPPGPTVADGMNEFYVSIDFAVLPAVSSRTALFQRFARIDIDSSPPAGRERLTIFCTLLI